MGKVAAHSPADLDARIKRIYDHLYANASVRTPAGIAAEVGKLIRTAAFMEGGAGVFPAFTMAPDVRSGLLKGEAAVTRRFASDLRNRFAEMKAEWKLYNDAPLLLSDADIAWCCAQLEGVTVSAGNRDVFGDAVEIFRTSWAKQSSGQFFTDSRVTHLAMILLQFDPFAGDDLVDICCGTGGFLLAGVDYISQLAEKRFPTEKREQSVADIALRLLRGQEIDPEICEIANASLACRLGHPTARLVQRGDSLLPSSFTMASENVLIEGTHRCAASNPPFGTKITVKSHEILRNYDLAKQGSAHVRPRAPDILLLERNIRMLKPGEGRLAIVLPYQILSGPQTRYIREWLLQRTHIEAVVDLPAETFQPHTGTKTSLLVVRRRAKPIQNPIVSESGSMLFMSTPKWIGHDRRGHPTYRRDPDGRPTAAVLSDIEDVGRAFEAFTAGSNPTSIHSDSFTIKLAQVSADPDLRLNARYYRERKASTRNGRARGKWKTLRLGDACERIFFPGRFKRNYVEPSDSAVPFLGGSNISELFAQTNKWISKDDPRLPDYIVREGWLLVTRSGTTGIVSSVPPAWDGVAMSEHVIRIVPRLNVISPAWIQAYLRSTVGQRALSRGVFGSVIDEITPAFIADLEVPVPNDKDLFARIVNAVEQAEESRQASIKNLRTAISEIESLLGH